MLISSVKVSTCSSFRYSKSIYKYNQINVIRKGGEIEDNSFKRIQKSLQILTLLIRIVQQAVAFSPRKIPSIVIRVKKKRKTTSVNKDIVPALLMSVLLQFYLQSCRNRRSSSECLYFSPPNLNSTS